MVAHREGFELVGGPGRGLGRGLVREPSPLRVDAERERLDDPGRAMQFGDGRGPAREDRAPALVCLLELIERPGSGCGGRGVGFDPHGRQREQAVEVRLSVRLERALALVDRVAGCVEVAEPRERVGAHRDPLEDGLSVLEVRVAQRRQLGECRVVVTRGQRNPGPTCRTRPAVDSAEV